MQKTQRRREYRGPIPPCVMIRAREPSNLLPENLILENRKKEEVMGQMAREVEAQRMSDLHTDWLTHADRKAWRNDIHSEMAQRLHVHELSVEERRERLRAQLVQEQEDCAVAMVEAEETPLQRKAKMRARIHSLREEKERDRLQLVQNKYDQQFREQCDELRSTLSRREQDLVCVERRQQVKDQRQQAADSKTQDALYDQLWEKDWQQKVAREEREALEAQQKNREAFTVLQKQRAALETQKEEAKKLKEEEHQLLKEQEALRQAEGQAAQEAKRRRQQETRDLLDVSLRTKMRRKGREDQEQLAFDLKMLEQLLEETRNEAREREQRKLELREEDRRYRDYLRQLLAEEKRKEAELERLLQAKCQADLQKQIDHWRAQHRMHQQLLHDVMVTRDQQIQDRLAENARQKEQHAREHAETQRVLEEERLFDVQQEQQRHAENVRYQGDLRQQMADQARQQQDLRRWQQYEYDMGLQAEGEYRDKVLHLLDHPHLERLHPMRRARLLQKDKETA